MNQNQLSNMSNRAQGTQLAPVTKDNSNQVVDPEILGFDHKLSQAGNAYVNFKKPSGETKPKGSTDANAKGKAVKANTSGQIHGEDPGEYEFDLSRFPSVAYSFMTPPDSTMDSSVYVRPKDRGSRNIRLSSGLVDGCEGMFEFGESAECWERQADAATNTRPIGYKELDLFPKIVVADAQTQVVPAQLEKAAATLRGIILNPHNILWSSNGDFSILNAEKQIEEFIGRCWKLCSRWYHHIQFLHAVEECYRNRYFFEVKWSLPTRENPIPIATASVYFAFDVEIYSGRDEPVKVHYVLEGTRFPHTPGEIPFQQKWLSGIICEKMRLMRSIKF
ncbi:unnamed protein product [Allacma fusca]|uniref:A-kinase anchor protein 14 n=1 Tax=Allacma fusca TaxID=39272 RepID=A0A8J2JM99_9HEXA|nr:unnamed protein product [Allacma fusca]